MNHISRTMLSLSLLTMSLSGCELAADDEFDAPRAGVLVKPICGESDLDFVVDFPSSEVEHLSDQGPVVVHEMEYGFEVNDDVALHFFGLYDEVLGMQVFVDGVELPSQKSGAELTFVVPRPEQLEPVYEFRFRRATTRDGQSSSQPTVILKPKKDCPTGDPPTPETLPPQDELD
ncbi:hypothetical protein [Enhygromyxa salina]|uniref:Lipoprotein n=1 Tax=Enhygromyxa salina TaxID=215803 RepID=A0A2S9YTE1_9BACT|nr:hypothetical protein [Enhygromyxa salina]PRQ08385.1 hypothetical protein ENSA7_20120 [Enhygromyxa salina]